MTDESIEEALDGLGSNDESIDAFWLDNEDQIINIVQFKASTSIQKVKENKAKREWFSYYRIYQFYFDRDTGKIQG